MDIVLHNNGLYWTAEPSAWPTTVHSQANRRICISFVGTVERVPKSGGISKVMWYHYSTIQFAKITSYAIAKTIGRYKKLLYLLFLCRIWGSHSLSYEEFYILGYNAVKFTLPVLLPLLKSEFLLNNILQFSSYLTRNITSPLQSLTG
jgi:hypothetical protein